ncbi:MAG TPA: hypothetical protein PLX35_16700 [Cyclobacteriaceae bacterium]|nr:hypothetical protein [Cyclobacteriaceae bacterium]
MIKHLVSILVVLSLSLSAEAQCAMCRATLENNVSNGDVGIAAGINLGILYLFVAPYLAVAVLGYLWYKTSKANERNPYRETPVIR